VEAESPEPVDGTRSSEDDGDAPRSGRGEGRGFVTTVRGQIRIEEASDGHSAEDVCGSADVIALWMRQHHCGERSDTESA
jgi:hypothetical protein